MDLCLEIRLTDIEDLNQVMSKYGVCSSGTLSRKLGATEAEARRMLKARISRTGLDHVISTALRSNESYSDAARWGDIVAGGRRAGGGWGWKRTWAWRGTYQ